MKQMYVYIMANQRPTLYTGVTNDLVKRVYQHKQEFADGFTKKYHIHKLVYFDVINGQFEGIIREKQIKNMSRSEKINLVKENNPTWDDLYPALLDSGQAGMTDKEGSGQATFPHGTRMTGGLNGKL